MLKKINIKIQFAFLLMQITPFEWVVLTILLFIHCLLCYYHLHSALSPRLLPQETV